MKASSFLFWVATAFTLVSPAQANPSATAMMESLGKLHPLQSKNFVGAKPAEVKALRAEFNSNLQSAKAQARAEFARLSAGKTPEQFDKSMREVAQKLGTPADVRQAIDALGGPHRVMQQADRILDDFAAEVLASSRQFAQHSRAEAALLALLGVGDAQAGWFKRGLCVAAVYAASAGTSPDSAYKLCDRYS